MIRLLWSPPMILGVLTAFWIGLGQGGFFLLMATLVERFLYAQRMGASVDNGGESTPLATLYFIAALALQHAALGVISEATPRGVVTREGLPRRRVRLP